MIRIAIERLTMEGLPLDPNRAEMIGSAVADELQLLFQQPGRRQEVSTAAIDRVVAPPLRLDGMAEGQLAVQLARSIAVSFCPSPSQEPAGGHHG